MSKLLRTTDKILFALSIIGDVFDNLRTVGGELEHIYENVYGISPNKFKAANYTRNWYRNIRSGNIEKVIDGNEVKFRITTQGKNKLARNFSLSGIQNKKWDKKWRIVIFDIPEKLRWRRDSLRKKLKELGFGMVEESAWISPHAFEDDIREFIDAQSLREWVYVFVSDNSYFTDDISDFIEKVWVVSELNERYKNILDSDRDGLFTEFTDLIRNDPFLPSEILPKPWYFNEAKKKVVTELTCGRNITLSQRGVLDSNK